MRVLANYSVHGRVVEMTIFANSADEEIFLSEIQMALVGDIPSQVEAKRQREDGSIRKIRWVSDAGIPNEAE